MEEEEVDVVYGHDNLGEREPLFKKGTDMGRAGAWQLAVAAGWQLRLAQHAVCAEILSLFSVAMHPTPLPGLLFLCFGL